MMRGGFLVFDVCDTGLFREPCQLQHKLCSMVKPDAFFCKINKQSLLLFAACHSLCHQWRSLHNGLRSATQCHTQIYITTSTAADSDVNQFSKTSCAQLWCLRATRPTELCTSTCLVLRLCVLAGMCSFSIVALLLASCEPGLCCHTNGSTLL